jgi:hypothetical protein
MASMTVPQRINDFLSQRQERMYCDTCIQERLGLKWRQQVQLITATLAVTSGFRREFNKCCTCEEIKQVTHAIGSQSHAAATTPKTSAKASTKTLTANLSPRRKDVDADALSLRFAAPSVQRTDYPVTAASTASVHRGDTN